MFGFFKKKLSQPMRPTNNENIIDKFAVLINLQLGLCRSLEDFQQSLRSDFVRGYFVGFFDCALQKLGEKILHDEDFVKLLIRGHSQVLPSTIADAQAYTFASMRLWDTTLFTEGQTAGGEECDALLRDKIPFGVALMKRIRNL